MGKSKKNKIMNQVVNKINKRLKSHDLSSLAEIYWSEEHYSKNDTNLFIRADITRSADAEAVSEENRDTITATAPDILFYDIDDLFYELLEKESKSISEELANAVFYRLSRDILSRYPEHEEPDEKYTESDFESEEEYPEYDEYDEENEYEDAYLE